MTISQKLTEKKNANIVKCTKVIGMDFYVLGGFLELFMATEGLKP